MGEVIYLDQSSLDSTAINAFLATSVGVFVIIVLSLWTLVWKAIALWKAARRTDTAWYVILTVLNTLGILEIIYIFAVAKEKK